MANFAAKKVLKSSKRATAAWQDLKEKTEKNREGRKTDFDQTSQGGGVRTVKKFIKLRKGERGLAKSQGGKLLRAGTNIPVRSGGWG